MFEYRKGKEANYLFIDFRLSKLKTVFVIDEKLEKSCVMAGGVMALTTMFAMFYGILFVV